MLVINHYTPRVILDFYKDPYKKSKSWESNVCKIFVVIYKQKDGQSFLFFYVKVNKPYKRYLIFYKP